MRPKMRKGREAPLLELTPFIDILFLIIIFFLFFSVIRKKHVDYTIQLPKSQHQTSAKESPLVLTIALSPQGLSYNGKKVSKQQLAFLLQKNGGRNKKVKLFIDRTTPYFKITELLDLLKQHQYHNISLVTEKK